MLSLKAKIGLGLLATYTTYTSYIYIRTQIIISKRDQEYKKYKEKINGLKKQKEEGYKFDDDYDFEHEDGNGCLHNKFEVLNVAGRFENPFVEYRPQTLFEFMFSRIVELFEGKSRGGAPSDPAELRKIIPIHKPNLKLHHFNANSQEEEDSGSSEYKDLPTLKNRLTYTWLGQSCSILQLSNITFLTDPLFEDYIINKTLGPKRITSSPAKLTELPIPDFVLVSHDHPDHLEKESIQHIANKSTWIVPLGVKGYLGRHGVYNVIEMSWWDRIEIKKSTDNKDTYEVICLPAMHWSGRKLYDTNQSLWCSFMILKNGKSIFYHAGDTGYSSDLFKFIGKKYGPVKLSMLPIGQYCPQWHQKPRHICPDEAYNIMKDLKSQKMIGVHWGTFILSSEKFDEPKLKLEEIMVNNKLQNSIISPQFGKTLVMDMSKENDTEMICLEEHNVYK